MFVKASLCVYGVFVETQMWVLKIAEQPEGAGITVFSLTVENVFVLDELNIKQTMLN